MDERKIPFEDGAAYDATMGVWSRLAGDAFLDWLAPAPKLRWIDIGCGSGAFTEQIVERCDPRLVEAVDPSEAQLAYARTRPAARLAAFRQGDGAALPFEDNGFDAATMALVLFFLPDPTAGLAEMTRVVVLRGLVSAYVWDIPGGGLPMAPIQEEMRAMGLDPLLPPSADISRLEALQGLWREAGLVDVETRTFAVNRTFADFEAYWANTLKIGNIGAAVERMTPDAAAHLKARTRTRLAPDADGRVTVEARANAAKGRVA